jgi:hypothetical protein
VGGSAADAQRDAAGLRGSLRASARRGAFPTGMPSEGSFPEEHHGRRLPSPLSPCPAWLFRPQRTIFRRSETAVQITTRSIPVAGVRSNRSGTLARFSTRRPAPPNPANAASKLKDVDFSLAGPANEPRSAESREPFQNATALDPTAGHPAMPRRLREQGRDLLPLRIGPVRAIGPFSALPFCISTFLQTTTILFSNACVRLCNGF